MRVFAYFQNLALIACFLGFGIGCYRANANKPSLFNGAALGTLVILVGLPFAPWQHMLEILSSLLSFSPHAQTWSALPSADDAHPVALFLVSAALISILLLAGHHDHGAAWAMGGHISKGSSTPYVSAERLSADPWLARNLSEQFI